MNFELDCYYCHRTTHAACKNHPFCLINLLNQDYDINQASEGRYALIEAVEHRNSKCLDIILSCNKLNLDVKYKGVTALGYSIIYGRKDTMIKLLNRGAKNNEPCSINSAVNIAITCGRSSFLKELLLRRVFFYYEMALLLSEKILYENRDIDNAPCYDVILAYGEYMLDY